MKTELLKKIYNIIEENYNLFFVLMVVFTIIGFIADLNPQNGFQCFRVLYYAYKPVDGSSELPSILVSGFIALWAALVSVIIYFIGKLDDLFYGISLYDIIIWKSFYRKLIFGFVYSIFLFGVVIVASIYQWPFTTYFAIIETICAILFSGAFICYNTRRTTFYNIIKAQSGEHLYNLIDTPNEDIRFDNIQSTSVFKLISNVDYSDEEAVKIIIDVFESLWTKSGSSYTAEEQDDGTIKRLFILRIMFQKAVHIAKQQGEHFKFIEKYLERYLNIFDNHQQNIAGYNDKTRHEKNDLIDKNDIYFIIFLSMIDENIAEKERIRRIFYPKKKEEVSNSCFLILLYIEYQAYFIDSKHENIMLIYGLSDLICRSKYINNVNILQFIGYWRFLHVYDGRKERRNDQILLRLVYEFIHYHDENMQFKSYTFRNLSMWG